MKPRFVADGEVRLKHLPAFQAKLCALRQEICARHAAEFLSAGLFRRWLVKWRIELEYRREREQIVPSPQALYSARE
jgi:hypothetical protein